MDNQTTSPEITPAERLATLILLLNNELQSLRTCMTNRFGWDAVVQSILRIFRTPEYGSKGQDATLVEFFSSTGLTKAFTGMYGDAFLHFTSWGGYLGRKPGVGFDPLKDAINNTRAAVGEIYLIQIIRFLEDHQSKTTNQENSSMTTETNDETGQKLVEACDAFIDARERLAQAYVDGANVHGALSGFMGTAVNLRDEASALVDSFEPPQYSKDVSGILSAAIDSTFIRTNDDAVWLRLDTVDTSDGFILAHHEDTEAPGDQIIQADELDPEQVSFKKLVEFKL